MAKWPEKCEVCNKFIPQVRCQYCRKVICIKCYGNLGEKRQCCGKEDDIQDELRDVALEWEMKNARREA